MRRTLEGSIQGNRELMVADVGERRTCTSVARDCPVILSLAHNVEVQWSLCASSCPVVKS